MSSTTASSASASSKRTKNAYRLSDAFVLKEWQQYRDQHLPAPQGLTSMLIGDPEQLTFPPFPLDMPTDCTIIDPEIPESIIDALRCIICFEIIHEGHRSDLISFNCGHAVCSACAKQAYAPAINIANCPVNGCDTILEHGDLKIVHTRDNPDDECLNQQCDSHGCGRRASICCMSKTSSCGHYLCCYCREAIFDEKIVCPMRCQSFSHRQMQKERYLKNLIPLSAVTFKCPWAACEFKGSLDAVQRHFSYDCNFTYRMCPQGCLEFVRGSDMKRHLDFNCKMRCIQCPQCNVLLTRFQLFSHTNDCPARLVPCPHGCTALQNPDVRLILMATTVSPSDTPTTSITPPRSLPRLRSAVGTAVVVGRPVGPQGVAPPPSPPFMISERDIVEHSIVCPRNQYPALCPWRSESGCLDRFKSTTCQEYIDHVTDVPLHIRATTQSHLSRLLPSADTSLETLIDTRIAMAKACDIDFKRIKHYLRKTRLGTNSLFAFMCDGASMMAYLEKSALRTPSEVSILRGTDALHYIRQVSTFVFVASKNGSDYAAQVYKSIMGLIGPNQKGAYAIYSRQIDLADRTFVAFIKLMATTLDKPDSFIYIYACLLNKGDIIPANPQKAFMMAFPVFVRNTMLGGHFLLEVAMRLCSGYIVAPANACAPQAVASPFASASGSVPPSSDRRTVGAPPASSSSSSSSNNTDNDEKVDDGQAVRDDAPKEQRDDLRITVQDVVAILTTMNQGDSAALLVFMKRMMHTMAFHMKELYAPKDFKALWNGYSYDCIDYSKFARDKKMPSYTDYMASIAKYDECSICNTPCYARRPNPTDA